MPPCQCQRNGVRRLRSRAEWPCHLYEPLAEEPVLFRILAATEESREGILAFASLYGSLGFEHDPGNVQSEALEPGYNVSKVLTKDAADRIELLDDLRQLRNGDFETQWIGAIRELGRAVGVLDRIRSGSVAAGEVRDLIGLCNDAWRKNSMAVEVAEAPEGGTFDYAIRPMNLYGALWYQVSAALVDRKEYGACPNCGRQFEVSKGRGRQNQRYCSDSCKSQAYRKRREEAIALAAGGLSDREIAAKLKSGLKTVRGWIRG